MVRRVWKMKNIDSSYLTRNVVTIFTCTMLYFFIFQEPIHIQGSPRDSRTSVTINSVTIYRVMVWCKPLVYLFGATWLSTWSIPERKRLRSRLWKAFLKFARTSQETLPKSFCNYWMFCECWKILLIFYVIWCIVLQYCGVRSSECVFLYFFL